MAVDEKYMTVIGHLEELRRVLLVSLIALLPASIGGWLLKDLALELLLNPLREINPGFKLIVLGPADKIVVDIKVALVIGGVLAMPVIIWQLWSFVKPALRKQEHNVAVLLVPATIILFLAGVAFSYFTVFKMAVQFFYGYVDQTTSSVVAAYALKEYIGFAVSFLLPFGVVF
ncbi:MAG TPA: twin-arginine translocase subunit TatC [Bacillota bacterium]|nr:twin-arginine translocase subunit TatC [Bacillota bacterium]